MSNNTLYFRAILLILCIHYPTISIFAKDIKIPTGQFSSDLKVEMLADNSGAVRLVEPLVFTDAIGAVWTVPKGYISDGASVPRYLWSLVGSPLGGKLAKASVVHDYYSDQRTRSTAATNRVFYEALLASGNSHTTAKAMYFAVEGFGPKWGNEVGLEKPVGEKLQDAISKARADAQLGIAASPTAVEKSAWEQSIAQLSYENLANTTVKEMITTLGSQDITTSEDVNELTDNLNFQIALSTKTKTAEIKFKSKQPSQGISFRTQATNDTLYDWYKFDEAANTVFVFVHGILSNKKSAWQSKQGAQEYFWPEIVLNDKLFGNPNIFLAGYYTDVGSGDYSIGDASDYLNMILRNEVGGANRAVNDFKNIIFVAHSMGGIIVRDMLVNERESFAAKNVGLVLFASPSGGSQDADRLKLFIEFLNNESAAQLSTDSGFLINLDRRFKKIISGNKIPNLRGQEAIENHFIFKNRFLNPKVLVSESSGGRYFNNVIRIPNSDHFSIVKPRNEGHPSHLLLRDFYKLQMTTLIGN